MIVSSFQSPSKSLFFIGGNILNVIHSYQFDAIDPLILFRKYSDFYDKLSFSYLMYGLDWLFMIGAIDMNENGDIKLCN